MILIESLQEKMNVLVAMGVRCEGIDELFRIAHNILTNSWIRLAEIECIRQILLLHRNIVLRVAEEGVIPHLILPRRLEQ